MGVPVYRTTSTVPQYTDISVYRYTPTMWFKMKVIGTIIWIKNCLFLLQFLLVVIQKQGCDCVDQVVIV